jgi:hypothetical protein
MPYKDIGSLELLKDFLGLESHLFEDFKPRTSSKSAISGA